jgi:hypothetical protein
MNDFATKKDLEVGLESVRAEIRAIGVIAVRTEAKVSFLAEALVSTRDELKRDIADVRSELGGQIGILEEVVRENSRDIRQNSADICALRDEVRELRLRHDRRDGDMVELQRSVSALRRRILEKKKR